MATSAGGNGQVIAGPGVTVTVVGKRAWEEAPDPCDEHAA